MAELENCPFCGGEAKLHTYTFDYGNVNYVQCKQCRNRTQEYAHENTAIKHWNRRPQID